MRHNLTTPYGDIVTENPWLDKEIVREVMTEDCYRLKDLAKVYTPSIVFDVGSGCGIVSMMASHLWPSAKVTAFEYDPHIATSTRANLPNAQVVEGAVGYQLTAKELTNRYGFADLLCIDCEGGEVPFFYDLFAQGVLERFPVICGEWHHWPGRRLLEACLQEKYHMRFVTPPEGAGPWNYFFAVHQGLPIEIAKGWGV
jgi:hypothetical protein